MNPQLAALQAILAVLQVKLDAIIVQLGEINQRLDESLDEQSRLTFMYDEWWRNELKRR